MVVGAITSVILWLLCIVTDNVDRMTHILLLVAAGFMIGAHYWRKIFDANDVESR
jgi:hypothetical protein